MGCKRYLVGTVLVFVALCLDISVGSGDQGADLQQPAKVTITFNATDAFVPDGKDLSSGEQFARYVLSYPMPPMPGSSYRCIRADVLAYPEGVPGLFPVFVKQSPEGFFVGGEEGGEILTKGCCDAKSCLYPVLKDPADAKNLQRAMDLVTGKEKLNWPLKAGFQVAKGAERQAYSVCRKEWSNRIPNPITAYSPYTLRTTYPGTIKVRYCYLNLTPTGSASATGTSATAAATWHTDCTQNNVTTSHNIDYPIEVTCRPQPIAAERAATSYLYSCSQNGFVVKGTTTRSTDRISPIPKPIPDNTCVPQPGVQAIVMQTCPAGYVIQGTNLNAKQTANQKPETCVWPTPAGQVQTRRQREQQLLLYPDTQARVDTQYQYTCPPNFVIPGTALQVVSYPTTKSGLTCDPRPGNPPVKADISVEWKYSCNPGMIIHGSQNQREVFEILPQFVEARDKACLPENWNVRACPFIFTQEAPGSDWLAQGTILTHHNGKEQEKTEIVELDAFSGSVLIQEVDPETSFIDALSVVLTYGDGSTETLLPERADLKAIDGRYLITNQGDAVVVGFSPPASVGFVKAEVRAYGYYEPYQP